MEQMRLELSIEGHEVQFITINKADAVDNQGQLVARCAFPLFQDLDTINAWGLMGGAKDDIYIYDAAGKLAAFLPINGSIETNLSTDEGYANLKNAILSVLP